MPRWNAPAPDAGQPEVLGHPPGVAPDRAASPFAGLGRLLQAHGQRAEIRKQRRGRDHGGQPSHSSRPGRGRPVIRVRDKAMNAIRPTAAPRMPARDIEPNRPPIIRHGGAAKPELRRVDRLGPRGNADAGARLRSVPRHGVADDERHRHRQPAREGVPADERPVRRRPGVQRPKVPVEQLGRRRALHRDEHRQRQAEPRHAARHRPDAAAREDRAGRTRTGRCRRRRARAPTPSTRHRATAAAPARICGAASRRSALSICERLRRQTAACRRRQRNQLSGDGEQAGEERPVEDARRAAADRRALDGEQHRDAGAQRHDRPAVRAGEGDERPADQEEKGNGRGRSIRPPLRRSSSCTGGRSSASSSTCSARNRPCSARPRRSVGRACITFRSRARPGGAASSRRR